MYLWHEITFFVTHTLLCGVVTIPIWGLSILLSNIFQSRLGILAVIAINVVAFIIWMTLSILLWGGANYSGGFLDHLLYSNYTTLYKNLTVPVAIYGSIIGLFAYMGVHFWKTRMGSKVRFFGGIVFVSLSFILMVLGLAFTFFSVALISPG